MPPKRMTANPARPARYRPGKPTAADQSSSQDDESEEDQAEASDRAQAPAPQPPKATSFPRGPVPNLKATALKNSKERERRQLELEKTANEEELERQVILKYEEDFVTEESGEESAAEEESESEDESNEEDIPSKLLVRPLFIKKTDRNISSTINDAQTDAEKAKEDEDRKKAAADEIVQEQLEKEAAIRAAGKKNWDDDESNEDEDVDDTDGLDPEAELAAWKLRELKRIKRDREVIELAEREREEVERRRNLSKEERDEEDREFIAQQKAEKDGKGQMGFMQKYYHKGAFFQDDAKEVGLDRRDIRGSRYQDDVANRELLPQALQIRDMTKIGKKGRSKYRDLKTEDTGRWGNFEDRGPRNPGEPRDERYLPDRRGGREGPGASGANATAVGNRRQFENAPIGSKAMESEARNGENNYSQAEDGQEVGDRHTRRDRNHEDSHGRHHSRRRGSISISRSRSPVRSRSRSRSRSRRRGDHRDRRKRSRSPYERLYDDDKRRRIETR
ncbi:MAG: hypothetical protein M1829_006896 [Trizodia sp. TS-e1964]|nr:MAG: hypothetical protein M1829_006896 [Trizodia sp. TS-e1964]